MIVFPYFAAAAVTTISSVGLVGLCSKFGRMEMTAYPRIKSAALGSQLWLAWLGVIFYIEHLWQTKPTISKQCVCKDLDLEHLGTRSGDGMSTSKQAPGQNYSTRLWPLLERAVLVPAIQLMQVSIHPNEVRCAGNFQSLRIPGHDRAHRMC